MKKIKNSISRFIYILYLMVTYKVFYLKDGTYNGWFIKKNPITMIIIAPFLIPFYMLFGIIEYYVWATDFRYQWIEGEEKKLTWKEKMNIKDRLSR